MHPSLTLDPLAQMWDRTVAGLGLVGERGIEAVVLLGALLALLLPAGSARGPAWARRPWVLVLGALAPIAVGVGWGSQLKWLPGDAFVTFRYAENLAHGRGLVWNPGEHVEGYSSFLWTVILGVAVRLGASPAAASLALGMASFGALLLLSWWIARQHAPAGSPVIVSIAALLLATGYLFASFSASGLETLFATLLALLALERAIAGAPMLAGALGILATMARPDLALLYLALGVALSLGRPPASSPRRDVLRYAVPLVVLFLPYSVWRWRTFGEAFPNTYYATSGGEAYVAQGIVYLFASILGGIVWPILPLGVIGAFLRRRELIGRYALVATPLFLLHVVRLGGDFMLGRLLLPVLPVWFLLAELALRDLFVVRRWTYLVPALASLSLAWLPLRLLGPGEKAWQIADERTFCQVTSLHPLAVDSRAAAAGKDLAALLGRLSPRPLLASESAGALGYFSGLPTIDYFGQTDRLIAHEPLPSRSRGRPGYEKHGTPSYALSRGVAVSDVPLYPDPYAVLTRFELDGVPLFLGTYDASLVAALRARPHRLDVNVPDPLPDVRAQLDAYAAPTELSRAACDFWFYDRLYFAKNDDPLRRASFYRKLRDVGLLDGATQAFAADPAHTQWHPVARLDFTQVKRSDWVQTGDAFSSWPTSVGRPAQGTILFGHDGPFLDTYDGERGDDALGVLQSPPFEIVGDVTELHVGGGRNLSALRVALVVDGKRVASSTGCDTEVMGRRLWSTGAYKGKRAVLEVTDDARGGWAHVLADAPVQWGQ